MNINPTQTPITDFDGDAVVVAVWSDEPLAGQALQVDQAAGGLLSKMIELQEVSTDRCTATTVHGPTGLTAPILIVVGLGARDEAPSGLARRAAGAASKLAAGKQRRKVGFYLDLDPKAEAVLGAITGCTGQDLFRNEPALFPFEEMCWWDTSLDDLQAGQIMGESVNVTRRMVNLPASEVYPESFADECARLGELHGFEVEVWDENRLADEGCGAHLAVGQASTRPPRTVIMRFLNGDGDAAPLGLVGKGVTFDSGGLSLKPGEAMLDMKCDMAGAATVLGAMTAIARLKLPVNVIGFAGLAENMVSGNSYKLGDVLTTRNGKTIEVHNTDAEGRLVLADTLNIAVSMGVGRIVDLATLTGACMVALGRDVAGLMTNDQEFCDELKSAADTCGEPVWQLPMFAEYSEHIRSKVADIKNVGDGRWGGAITAAKLLEEFVDQKPWVHIDIAGPSFGDKPKAWIDAGASGCLVQTLVELARG